MKAAALLLVLALIAPPPAAVVAFVAPAAGRASQRWLSPSTSSTASSSRSSHPPPRRRAPASSRRTTSPPSLARPVRTGGASSSSLAASSASESVEGDSCDVLVLGSGPAGRAIATLLAASPAAASNASPLDVVVADANYDRRWIPNYGAWEDEWESIRDLFGSFGHPLGPGCVDRLWKVTDCFFGGSFDTPVDQRTRLDRPYVRVDRDGLRRTLSPRDEVDVEGDGEGEANYRVLRADHVSKAAAANIFSPAGTMAHDESGTAAVLRSKDGTEARVRAKLIVDCTGHETRLVLKDDRAKSIPPGYQIAYGALVTVDESSVPDASVVGPYDKEAMTLFDYRTDHFVPGSDEESRAERGPTFMYAMPLGGNKIFFEETSLVARPALSFRECKERCATRLEHLGIKVTGIEEEEYCYIPMGGPLPARDQRIVGLGGACAMVHPSTGYHLCRALMGAGAAAKVLREELSLPDKEWNPDRAAARAYDAIWSPSNVAQRNFAVFGGEFLMKQNVEGLRGFFDGFFKLPLPMWGGFLAGWPGLPNNEEHETWWKRLVYGLTFVSKLPPKVALDMFGSIVAYSITEGVPLPQSVTPLLGLPDGYEYKEKPKNVGDVAAKAEARAMIGESTVEDVIPVDFEEKVLV
ncbi:hypothetical protein ACHAWF_006524 [Thalassiosira exigua]